MPVFSTRVTIALPVIAAVLRAALVLVIAPIAPALAAVLISSSTPLLPSHVGHVPALGHPP